MDNSEKQPGEKNTMNTELIYRAANVNDADEVVRIAQVSFGKYLPHLSPENQEKLQSSLSNKQNALSLISDSTGFVCEHNGIMVGMAFLFSSGKAWEFFPAEWSYIRMLGVDPGYEGRGIARTLTNMCLDQAKKTGEKTLALHTSEKMEAARHIYESLGFTINKELEPRLGMRYWLYTLAL
jgi:ribosomal protein S18 acetylase RimI-like enzyme